MRQLGFKGRYIQPILNGTKTTTIRPADKPLPQPGDTVNLRCRYDKPPFAQALVASVNPITLDELTDQDAQHDGHDNAAELAQALHDLYANRPLVIIHFALID